MGWLTDTKERRISKEVCIGNVWIGGTHPIAIQSMANTKTENVEATVAQILDLEKAGCEIIRCAVPTMEAAKALAEIKKQISIPLVADIHFDYRLAIAAMEHGEGNVYEARDALPLGDHTLRAVWEERMVSDEPPLAVPDDDLPPSDVGEESITPLPPDILPSAPSRALAARHAGVVSGLLAACVFICCMRRRREDA